MEESADKSPERSELHQLAVETFFDLKARLVLRAALTHYPSSFAEFPVEVKNQVLSVFARRLPKEAFRANFLVVLSSSRVSGKCDGKIEGSDISHADVLSYATRNFDALWGGTSEREITYECLTERGIV